MFMFKTPRSLHILLSAHNLLYPALPSPLPPRSSQASAWMSDEDHHANCADALSSVWEHPGKASSHIQAADPVPSSDLMHRLGLNIASPNQQSMQILLCCPESSGRAAHQLSGGPQARHTDLDVRRGCGDEEDGCGTCHEAR